MPRAATRTATAPITTGAMQGERPTQRVVPATGNVFANAGSVFAANGQRPTQRNGTRGGSRVILPDLDMTTIQVRSDLAIPSTTRGDRSKGLTRYDAIFDQLVADGMSATGIPIRYRAAITKAMQTYLRGRPQLAATSRLAVRTIDGESCGVWRVPK